MRVNTRGAMPGGAAIAMAPSATWEAAAVERAMEDAGVVIGSAKSADLIAYVSFDAVGGSVSSISLEAPAVGGGNMPNHQDGGKGLWFHFGGDESEARFDINGAASEGERWSAVLLMRVVERLSGDTVWVGQVVEEEWAERVEAAQVEWVKRASKMMVREFLRARN